MVLRVKSTTKFRKLFEWYAKEKKGSEGESSLLIFKFDGHRILEDQTPQILGMEDNDQIDAVVMERHSKGQILNERMEDKDQTDSVLTTQPMRNTNGAIPPRTKHKIGKEHHRNNYKILRDLMNPSCEKFMVSGSNGRREIVTQTLHLMDKQGIFFSDELEQPLPQDQRHKRLFQKFHNTFGAHHMK